MSEKQIRIANLVELLKKRRGNNICPEQLQELIEKSSREITEMETAKKILQPPRLTNFLSIDLVIKALSKKGLEVKLTQKEEKIYKEIPFSQETLEMAANKEWRGKRAILWAAPPGITMLKLREIFGTDPNHQPCIYNNDWWLSEAFAKETLRPGYHLTLVELPRETKNKSYKRQKALMTKQEQLVKPVELTFLALTNFIINNNDRILKNGYFRTDMLGSGGSAVYLGRFVSGGFHVGIRYWPPDSAGCRIGLLLSRKFD